VGGDSAEVFAGECCKVTSLARPLGTEIPRSMLDIASAEAFGEFEVRFDQLRVGLAFRMPGVLDGGR